MAELDTTTAEVEASAPQTNGATAAPPKAQRAKKAKGKKAKKKQPTELRPSTAPKPTRVLPTTRISFAKQLELLRAFAVAAGPNVRAVSLKEAADIIKIASQTVSLGTPFFFDVGLIRKGEAGKAIPSDPLRAFNIAHEWEPATASRKLAPVFLESWFWEAIQARLRHQRSMQEHEVLAAIQKACAASQQHKPQLLQLLAFLQVAGLIERDGTVVRIGPTASETYPAVAASAPESLAEDSLGESDGGRGASNGPAATMRGVATTFSHGGGAQGMLRFNISVNVDMSEMGDWKPDRIAALFAGLAQVLAAKAGVEQGAS